MNSVPGVDITLPQYIARKVLKVEVEAGMLLAELMGTPVPARGLELFAQAEAPPEKVGRNDPCPCGSGKKFKKCHGRN